MTKLSDLAAVLMKKHGLTQNVADKFMANLVDVLNDGLRDDKVVKWKGFGTFKVTSVSARESVNVNTGERITIEGREKITFTPETAVKDLVNKPFAQFETVVVNDGVEFSELDSVGEEVENALNEEEKAVEEVGETVAPVVTPLMSAVEKEAPQAEETPVEEPVEEAGEPAETEEPAAETIEPAAEEVKEEVEKEAPQAAEPAEEPALETPNEPRESEPQAEEKTEEGPSETQNEDGEGHHNHHHHHSHGHRSSFREYKYFKGSDDDPDVMRARLTRSRIAAGVLGALLVLLLGGAAYGYWKMNNALKARDSRINSLVAQLGGEAPDHGTPPPPGHPGMQKPDNRKPMTAEQRMAARASQAMKTPPAPPQNPASAPKTAPAQPQKPAVAAQKPAPAPANADYNKDERVRTGAYIITGIAQTVTARPGQTLKSISKAHLGPGMECYIEAVNGGIKQVTAGQQVKIPALKMKKLKK